MASPPESRLAFPALALVSVLIQLPFLRRGISLHDEGSILAIADALQRGEVLYRDRLTTIGPITYEILGAIFRLTGPSFLAARVLMVGVFAGCVLLGYAVLRRLVPPRAALLGAIAFLALKPVAFRVWTMLNYSQVSILLALGAIWLALRFFETKRGHWLAAAGLAAGLASLSKWNVGAALGVALAATVAFDWRREAGRRASALVGRGALLFASAALPVALTIGAYAIQGAAASFLDQSIVRVAVQRVSYWVPLPGLELWATAAGGLGMNAYRYFPPALFNLGWHGALDLSSVPLVLAIELFVKVAYYAPLALLALGTAQLVRSRGTCHPTAWSGRLLLFAFGAVIFASMLHRPDWSHLVNIYPALLLSSLAALAPPGGASPWLRRCGLTLGAVWVAGAAALTGAVLSAYATPIETRHGPIWTTPSRADQAAAVLTYLEDQPPDDVILVLRGEPMYYFLSGRAIVGAYDLFAPGMVDARDDAQLAAQLPEVDQVVFTLRSESVIPRALGEYGPLTAAGLARDFAVERMLTPGSAVLRPRPAGFETVVDLWERTAGLEGVRRDHWAVYRVLRPEPALGRRSCLEVPHVPAGGEEIRALPLFPPEAWNGSPAPPTSFELAVRDAAGERRLASAVRTPGPPGPALRAPLDARAEGPVTLRLCITAPADADAPGAGFAEVAVVRGPSPATD